MTLAPMKDRSLLHLGLAAFALRAVLAWLTESHPIFPSYYFNDSRLYDSIAWEFAQYWSGLGPKPTWMPPYAVYQCLLGAFYSLVGHQVLAAKLLNALLGTATAVLIGGLGRRLFDRSWGTAAGWAFALMPSCIFFNSQIHKDNIILALAFGALSLLASASDRLAEDQPALGPLAGAAALLLAGTLFRLPVMMVLAAAFALAQGLQWLRTRRVPTRAGLQVALFLAVMIGGRQAVFQLAFAPHSGQSDAVLDRIQASSVEIRSTPITPHSLSEFRNSRQEETARLGRTVQTLILPEAKLDSWLDIALFLPRGFFYAAFMPLPGLYPIDGNLGRLGAAVENAAALLLALLGLWGAVAVRKSSSHWVVLFSFCGLAGLSALVEIDLGSAARHKLQYLPLLFLFAAAALPRLRDRCLRRPG
ncbi:MAG TPA: hypothetical protein DD417_05335 [Elusimicrobia bacterium]|nr:hypothetical protein [Elusimicrobiota bacterium]